MNTEQPTWRAGVATICITPDLPAEMAGYFHSRIADRVARDLYATALAVERNGTCVVFVSADLIAMTDEICAPAFEYAAREYGIPPANCFACATHTHTGPEVRRESPIPACEGYLKAVPDRITDVVKRALDDLSPAYLTVGTTRAPGLAHNRLSRCADGTEVFGRQFGNSPVIGAAGPIEDLLQTLNVYDEDKRLRAMVVSFACHPDISGGGSATAIDSDWPGEMADYLRRVHGQDLACLFLQGPAGDVNQNDARGETPRLTPPGRSTIARGVAGAALYSTEIAAPLAGETVAGRRETIDLPYYVRDDTLRGLVETLRRKGDGATYFERNLVKRVDGWDKEGRVDHVDVTCLRIGDLCVVATPGEMFTAWGMEIRRYSPARNTFVVELAGSHDGLTGYIPTSDQALRGARAKGGYGALPVMSQKHTPAAGQMMVEAAIRMLHELWSD